VGVAPNTAPLLDAIVTLCASGELLVNWIVTVPALTLSDVVSNFSAPPGPVASLSSPPVAAAEGGVAAVLEVADGADGLPGARAG
jgi:hypothetical protein